MYFNITMLENYLVSSRFPNFDAKFIHKRAFHFSLTFDNRNFPLFFTELFASGVEWSWLSKWENETTGLPVVIDCPNRQDRACGRFLWPAHTLYTTQIIYRETVLRGEIYKKTIVTNNKLKALLLVVNEYHRFFFQLNFNCTINLFVFNCVA